MGMDNNQGIALEWGEGGAGGKGEKVGTTSTAQKTKIQIFF